MNLLTEAFIIMTLGMAVTFAFVGVVIAAVNLTARITHRIEGPPQDEPTRRGSADEGAERARLAAVIATALHDGKPS
jgi:sodium pump decarboxylase gamma subunit